LFTPILIPAHNPGPMTGPGNNTYLLLDSQGEATLVDAGVGKPAHLAAIRQHLSESVTKLEQVLATHAHPDHISGASALAEEHAGARFFKHLWPEMDAKYLVEWQPLNDGDRVTAGGETLVVLHTPGHSPDHLAFWHEPSGTMFTGDLVVQGGSVMIHSSKGGDLGQYLASLERVGALKPRRLLPAHGEEITDPAAVLTAYVNHRLARERQVMAALAAGRDTVESIAKSIYDGLDPALMLAAHETIRAHLDKLKRERRAFEEDARWKA
jgi:glyoxylase-like metal-dependent hydrolase (beta-lactamase superfamily II)